MRSIFFRSEETLTNMLMFTTCWVFGKSQVTLLWQTTWTMYQKMPPTSHTVQNELMGIRATAFRHEYEHFRNRRKEFVTGSKIFRQARKLCQRRFSGFHTFKRWFSIFNVANAIISTLKTWDLNSNNAVRQGYDGWSTMRYKKIWVSCSSSFSLFKP